MAMTRTTISVPEELLKAASRNGINVSGVCRDAISLAVGAIDATAELTKLRKRVKLLEASLPDLESIIDQYYMMWSTGKKQMNEEEWEQYLKDDANMEGKRTRQGYPGDEAYKAAFKVWLNRD